MTQRALGLDGLPRGYPNIITKRGFLLVEDATTEAGCFFILACGHIVPKLRKRGNPIPCCCLKRTRSLSFLMASCSRAIYAILETGAGWRRACFRKARARQPPYVLVVGCRAPTSAGLVTAAFLPGSPRISLCSFFPFGIPAICSCKVIFLNAKQGITHCLRRQNSCPFLLRREPGLQH